MTLRLDYSHRDQEQLEADVQRLLREEIPEWTDFLDSDVGWAVVRTVAGLVDHANFYLDRQAAETFLSSAEYRSSIVAIAKSLGYNIRAGVPATASVRFQLQVAYPVDILIPRDTVVTISGIPFVVDRDTVLPALSTAVTTVVKQGQRSINRVSSTGDAWQQVQLPMRIADVVVTVDGVEWTRTSSFIRGTVANVYRLYESRAGWVVLFGGGVHGNIPPAGAAIVVEGIVTLGDKGNVEGTNLPAEINSVIYDATGVIVTERLSAVTTTAALGGSSEEPMEAIRANAPQFFAAQDRAVTNPDYEAIARTVSGVVGVRSWGGEEVNQYGRVFIAVHGDDPNNVPDSLLLAVREALRSKNVSPITYIVQAPVLITANLATTAYVTNLENITAVQNGIIDRQREYVRTRGIGGALYVAELQALLAQDTQVDHANVTVVTSVLATVSAGLVAAPIIQHVDLATIRILQVSDNTVLWEHGDAPSRILDGILSAQVDAPDGTVVRVEAQSQYPDVYPQRNHILAIGSQDVTTTLVGAP